MTEVAFGGSPIPIHGPFHASGEYERALFGAFGSGKTYAICDEAIDWCFRYPGIRGLITRKTVPELRDTTEPVFFERLPYEVLKAGELRRAGGHAERFIFPNGSEVLFRGIDDWNKHRSLNVGFIAWDEANEFDEETYLGMSSRVRQREPTAMAAALGAGRITRRGMWLATNPNGHDWLYRRFVDPKHRAPNTDFFRSTSFDNPYLPPEYLESLLNYPKPWVRRYVLCQFDDFAGAIYQDWGWDSHVVEPFKQYPEQHTFWMGMDPGSRSPTAGLWVCADLRKRQLVGIAEYEQADLAAHRHAEAWREIERRHKMRVSWRVADPNSLPIRDRGSNHRLSDQYRRLGFNFQLGPSRHQDRFPMLGQLISLKRFVVTKDCPRTYEAIKNYRWDDITPAMRAKGVDPPEKPLKKDDHLVDCAQYLSSRWVAPPRPDMVRGAEDFTARVNRLTKLALKRKQMGGSAGTSDLGSVMV